MKIIALVLAATTALSISISANAADLKASYYNGSIYAQGQPIICLNANQQKVPVLAYNGTTYIPIRTAGEWMGKNVSWDGETKTVSLSGTAAQVYYNSFDAAENHIPSVTPNEGSATMTLRPDIQVTLDGKAQTFKNVKGQQVYPMAFQGTTYLPLRNIGDLMGMEVLWVAPSSNNGNKHYIYLRSAMTAAQKAEVDSYLVKQNNLLEQLTPSLKTLCTLKKDGDPEPSLTELKNMLSQMSSIQKPSASFTDFSYQRYSAAIQKAKELTDSIITDSAASEINDIAEEVRDHCVDAFNWLVVMGNAYNQDGTSHISMVNFC